MMGILISECIVCGKEYKKIEDDSLNGRQISHGFCDECLEIRKNDKRKSKELDTKV
jgi:hypothetical protein